MNAEDLTGKSRVIQNVMASWLSYFVFLIAGFVLPHQIDSQLGAAELGVWDFCWTLVNYLSLSAIGIGSALNRYVAKYRAENDIPALQRAVSTVVCIQAALALFVVFCALLGSVYLPAYFPVETVELSVVIAWLGLALAFQFLFDTSRGVLTGVHRWDYFNALNAGCYLVAVIGMLTALYMGYGIDVLAMIYALMQLIQGSLRTIVARIVCPEATFKVSLFDRGFALEITSFGIKSIVISITGLLAIQTTSFLLMYKLGPIALAIFTRPIALARHIENILSRFTFILTPMAGSIDSLEGRQKLKSFVIDSARYGMAFSLPAIVLYAVFGHLIIELWMGSLYVDEYLVATLALGFLIPMSQAAIVRVLIGIDEHGPAAVLSLASLLVIFPIMWLLIDPVTNQQFALLAVVPLSLVNGLVIPIYACRRIGLGVLAYFRGAFARVMVIGVPPSLLLAALESQYEPGWVGSVSLAMGYLGLMAVLYYLFLLPKPFKRQAIRIVRQFTLTILSATGIDRLLLKIYSNRITILKLHGVYDEADQGAWKPTWDRNSAQQIDAVLGELAKSYTFISLDEAVDMITGKTPMRRHCMVLTFDDGYKNNIDVALPILRKYGCPLNLFVSTRFVAERDPFWIDRLDYALQHSEQDAAEFKSDEMEFRFQLESRDELAESYKKFRQESAMVYSDDYRRNEHIAQFAEELEKNAGDSLDSTFKGDTWSETVDVSDFEVLEARDCIGAHTVNHVRLQHVSPEQVDYELVESKQALEGWTGRPCVHFCYPEGEYAEDHIAHVKRAGFRSACTSWIGTNQVGDDVYQLKRIPFPGGSTGKEVRYHLLRNYFARP